MRYAFTEQHWETRDDRSKIPDVAICYRSHWISHLAHPVRKASDVRFNALTVMPNQESSIGPPFGKAVETVKSDSLAVIFKEAASEDVHKYIVVLMIQSVVFCPILA